jgi:ABC-2 type transport system permease protein
VRREWIGFIRYPSWIIQMFIWPIIFPLIYILTGRALAGPDGSGLATFAQHGGSADFYGYITIGTTIWMWQNIVLWNVGWALRNEQLRGTLETNWLSPTGRFTFLLGSSIPQFLSMCLFLIISAFEFAVFYGLRMRGNPWLALLLFLACIPSIYGLGFAFASLVITAKEAGGFVALVRGLVMIFCGITFPISVLPGWMQQVAAWMPQTYMMHSLRLVILEGAGLAQVWPDLRALLLFGVFWLAAGSLVFAWMERHTRRTGAIGHY